jgi:hypothetical protein
MLIMKSPNRSGITVILSYPFKPPANDWDLSYYQLVTEHSADGREKVVEDLRGSDAAFAATEELGRWSPDGNYLILIHAESILTRPVQSLRFLTLEDEDFVDFATASGMFASASNFNGWYPDKPHSAKIITASKSRRYVEALPQQ